MVSDVILIILGFGSGSVVAAAVFAFIVALGIVPRMAQRTKTHKWARLYEDTILLGGIFGTSTMFLDFKIPLPPFLMGGYALATGMFVGILAIAVAEVLNAMPIFLKRARLKHGISFMLMAFACGKVFGSLLYFLIDGFYTP